jgi:CheY-like chemotaxis protein
MSESTTESSPHSVPGPERVDPLVALNDSVPPGARIRVEEGGPVLDNRVLNGTTVLLIDDDFRNTYAMTALLTALRASVVVASSGPAGIVMLVNTPGIDLVLMDIMMPVMDGYETIRTLRTIGRFGSLPIIAVTGKVVNGERQRCIAAGANDYIPKPVDSLELLTAIRPWLPDGLPTYEGPLDRTTLG